MQIVLFPENTLTIYCYNAPSILCMLRLYKKRLKYYCVNLSYKDRANLAASKNNSPFYNLGIIVEFLE